MNNLLSFSFWFNPRPGLLTLFFQNGLIGYIAILALFTVVIGIIKSSNKDKIYQNIWQSLFSFCLVNALLGLLGLFFIYELIPILSSRFWFLLICAEMGIWLFFIGKKLSAIPEKKNQMEKEKEFKKYIP